jgi:3-deoxy-D-manno-octulosonic acid kinase
MGKEIAKMHNAGVYHHDLNIQNILKDEQDQIWLIDFDKCFSTKQLTQAQCQMNIARLHRSIEKKRKLHTDYVFTDKHWQALLDTYEDTLLIAS